jgi:hypothetical protein
MADHHRGGLHRGAGSGDHKMAPTAQLICMVKIMVKTILW